MTGIFRQPGDFRILVNSFMVSCKTFGGHISILVTTTKTGTFRARARPRCSETKTKRRVSRTLDCKESWTLAWVYSHFVPRTKSYFAPWLNKRNSLLNKFLVRGEINSYTWNEMPTERNYLRETRTSGQNRRACAGLGGHATRGETFWRLCLSTLVSGLPFVMPIIPAFDPI